MSSQAWTAPPQRLLPPTTVTWLLCREHSTRSVAGLLLFALTPSSPLLDPGIDPPAATLYLVNLWL
jgi:hypothetical protein